MAGGAPQLTGAPRRGPEDAWCQWRDDGLEPSATCSPEQPPRFISRGARGTLDSVPPVFLVTRWVLK